LIVVWMSYVGFTDAWLLSGIQAIEPDGSLVTIAPSATGVLLRNQPSLPSDGFERMPGWPV
jgi:hypothetical protein